MPFMCALKSTSEVKRHDNEGKGIWAETSLVTTSPKLTIVMIVLINTSPTDTTLLMACDSRLDVQTELAMQLH